MDSALHRHRRVETIETMDTIGPYRIVRLLGHGGMGVVYQGEHRETGEQVALKTVNVSHATAFSSIRREIHALGRIDHPGVVRIFAEGVEDGRPWYAMELFTGRTLAALIAELARAGLSHRAPMPLTIPARPSALIQDVTAEIAPPMPPESDGPEPHASCFTHAAGGDLTRILTLVCAICDALACIHGTGLVHGDLKPDNIFLRDDDIPVLADFGLAALVSGAQGRDVLSLGALYMGSPAYMAPEQIYGESIDARVDLYALGCMLYECVTGCPPFVGSSATVLQQHISRRPEPPSAKVQGVPPNLDKLILQLLAKRPQERPGYADDVASALAGLGATGRSAMRKAPAYLCRPGLFGRTEALDALEEHLARALSYRGGRVLVGGVSGVGKTRLAMEVAARAARLGLRVVTCECAAVSAANTAVRAAPLHPFRNLLLAIADHCREHGPTEAARILGDRGPVLAAYEPALGRLPDQDPYPELPSLSSPAARARLQRSLADVIAAFAQERPLFIVLDDLQWADESSLGFLQSLEESWCETTGVLVLGTYRSEELGPGLRELLDAPGVTRIDLNRLDDAAVGQMVCDMLATRVPSSPFIDFLVHQSEGNPFFVTEYLRVAIAEEGLYRDADGQWQVTHAADAGSAAPEGSRWSSALRDLVRRQVAGLGAAGRELARMAAVLGREFDAELLGTATHLEDSRGLEAVQELRTRQILEGAGARLRFVHDKLREVIYGEIPEEERPRLHAAAGAAIEARYVGTSDLPAFYPILAHHFTIARDDEKSREYLGRAGERALATGASAEALSYLRQALEVDERCRARAPLPLVLRASWEQQAGRAAFNLAHFADAERFTLAALRHLGSPRVEAMDTAPSRSAMPWVLLTLVFHLILQMICLLGFRRRLASEPSERQRLTRAAHTAEQLAQIHFYQGETVRAFLAAVQANNLAERLGPSPELARGYASLSTGFYAIPLPALAEVYKRRARAAAAAISDPQARSWVSFLAGVTEFINADWAATRASLGSSLAMARSIQDYRRAEECLGLLGDVEMFGGRPEDALRIIDELEEVANKSGDTQGQLWALSSRGECLTALGRSEEALALFERYQALCRPDGSDPSERITLGEVALVHFLRGDTERARSVAESTLTCIASRASSSFNLLPSYVATAEVLLGLWERAGAPAERAALERSARRAVQVLRRYARSFPIGRPYAHRFRGLCEALTGKPARALRTFARSLAEAERLAMPAAEGLAHYEIGRHQPATDPSHGLHLARAREIFEHLGMRYWLALTQRALSEPSGGDASHAP